MIHPVHLSCYTVKIIMVNYPINNVITMKISIEINGTDNLNNYYNISGFKNPISCRRTRQGPHMMTCVIITNTNFSLYRIGTSLDEFEECKNLEVKK